jgi:hypothetical protein
MKARQKRLDEIKAQLQAAFDNKDPQKAAEILADLNLGIIPHGPNRIPLGLALDVASGIGFDVEYYNHSIRVYLPA